jgi:short-subunit dehydrogenase
MEKVLILGACSGIAQAVQKKLAADGKELLLVARSAERLAALKADLMIRGARSVLTLPANLEQTAQQIQVFEFVQKSFPQFDTLLLAYGCMLNQQECENSAELTVQQLHTDFTSAAAILNLFAGYFEARKQGCIAVITSVAGDRVRRSNYVYGAAKSALTHFLEGLRSRLRPAGVRVITIKPGPVATPMTAHLPRNRPFASPERVAKDIYATLEKRSPDVVYTPGYWRYIMRGLRVLPEPILRKLP